MHCLLAPVLSMHRPAKRQRALLRLQFDLGVPNPKGIILAAKVAT